MRETYEQWFKRVNAERSEPHYKTLRHGQYLYNRMPDRFMGKIPTAYDPYNNDANIPEFLTYIEHRWDRRD